MIETTKCRVAYLESECSIFQGPLFFGIYLLNFGHVFLAIEIGPQKNLHS